MGDIFLDTGDTLFYEIPSGNFANLKNTVAHEVGHAFGLGESYPADCTRLMGDLLCWGAFVGPQDDDIRGAQRLYGDIRENNDTNDSATNLDVVWDTTTVDTVSIDHAADPDWYRFRPEGITARPPAEGWATIRMDAIGSCYFVGCSPDTASWVWVCTDEIMDLDIFLYDSTGTVLLDSACSAGPGENELISHFLLPYHGPYLIEIIPKSDSVDDVQRYRLTVFAITTGVEPGTPRVGLPGLEVAPNPFNPATTIRFSIPIAGPVALTVHDITGRRVTSLAEGVYQPGEFTAMWNGLDDAGRQVPSGTYFARLHAREYTETRKMVLLK
jgi:hypothetical protein